MIFELIPGVHATIHPGRRDRFGGNGVIGGSPPTGDADGRAKILNAPARVQITVLEPTTFSVVARTVSKEDGTWRVPYLDTSQRFTVIGTDWSMAVNSAIQDWVQPHPMDE